MTSCNVQRERLIDFPQRIQRVRLEDLRERIRLNDSVGRVRVKDSNYDTLTILEIENGQCRYPVKRRPDGLQEHLFCGRPCKQKVVDGRVQGTKVYCDWHHGKTVDRRPRERW